jgi:hypothetical protein
MEKFTIEIARMTMEFSLELANRDPHNKSLRASAEKQVDIYFDYIEKIFKIEARSK